MPFGNGQPSPPPSKRLNVPRRHAHTTRDFSRWETGGKLQTNDLARLAHRNSFRWHRSLPWIAKGATLNRPAEALVAVKNPGRHHSVPVGGIISFWWAASFRYDGRHHLVLVGDIVRNQQAGGLAGLNAAPEPPLGRHQEMLVERIGSYGHFDPFAPKIGRAH